MNIIDCTLLNYYGFLVRWRGCCHYFSYNLSSLKGFIISSVRTIPVFELFIGGRSKMRVWGVGGGVQRADTFPGPGKYGWELWKHVIKNNAFSCTLRTQDKMENGQVNPTRWRNWSLKRELILDNFNLGHLLTVYTGVATYKGKHWTYHCNMYSHKGRYDYIFAFGNCSHCLWTFAELLILW